MANTNFIFVIGRNRSGTKWLSNLIAGNSEVAAVQREGAGGILEIDLLSTFPKHYNLKNIEERTAFEILFRYSNFHKCSGLPDSIINEIDYRNFYEFFTAYGTAIAESRKKSVFLQKGASKILPVLVKRFPQAKFVIIQRRNVVENLVSNLVMHGEKVRLKRVFTLLLGYWRFRKLENTFISRPNVMRITYENLKGNTESVMKEVCNFLNLEYEKAMLNVPFKPNSSYKAEGERKVFIDKKTKMFVSIVSPIVSAVPLWLFNILLRLKVLAPERGGMFMPKSYELYRNEIKKNEAVNIG